MTLQQRITETLQRWFLSDSALFQVLCSHELVENSAMHCAVRCGKGRVEYNPLFLENMSDAALDEALRTEAVRILLRHPYERKPDQCSDQAISVGSNITIGDSYKYSSMNIERPEDYDLEKGMPYEWYSRRIQELLPESSGNGSGSAGKNGEATNKLTSQEDRNRDLSELWDEDELMVSKINGIIQGVKDWGSLSGRFAEEIIASTKARINWRNAFSGFRASVLSSRKRLTRMKPSRRYGFDAMGYTREFNTRLLIAVDVSGSISSESLSYFYGVISSAFRYGFEAVDVIQFDCGITSVQSLKKAKRDVEVVGRGGTSFQEPIDFAVANDYDGLLILTDGYAPVPKVPEHFRSRILWVCEDLRSYRMHQEWMSRCGRVTMMELR